MPETAIAVETPPQVPPIPPVIPPQPVGIQVPPATPAPTPSKLEDAAFLSRLGQEALSKGDLSAESYAELKAAGVPETLAKQFVRGAIADHQQTLSKIHTECGGKEAVETAVAWAAKNLPQATIDALNTQLADPNPEVVINALKGLQARQGGQGGTVAGKTGGNTGPVPYESEAQWLADTRNPLYRSDPAFRAKVAQRLQGAMNAGIISSGGIVNKGPSQ
jgi:hypothetical protein